VPRMPLPASAMASQKRPSLSLEEFIARIAANLANALVEPEEAARGLSVRRLGLHVVALKSSLLKLSPDADFRGHAAPELAAIDGRGRG
jgi:hypothetical protein